MPPLTTSSDFAQDFFRALEGEDELGVVVRAHIYIESALTSILARLVVDPAALHRLELDYSQKVNLAVALGLQQRHAPALNALGTLRNAFAHQPVTRLTKNRINSVYKALDAADKTLVHQIYERVRGSTENRPPAFRQLEPKDQFTIIAVSLHAMLRAALVQLDGDA